MIFPLLPKLRTTRRRLTQTTSSNDGVSCLLPQLKHRSGTRGGTRDGILKNSVALLLLSAATFLPNNLATAQTSQQEYLQQQAAALKAQMVRAQIEQSADRDFAEKAYNAQQAYLIETAEKSFRIGKPHTTESHLVSGQAESYQSRPATPPVHVAPDRYSVPPRQQPTYVNSAPPAVAPQHYRKRAHQVRTVADLPDPAEFADQGQSVSSPANRVGLQDRLTRVLVKPKYRTRKLPTPEFAAAPRQQPVPRTPTPAVKKHRPIIEQPLFAPEPRITSTQATNSKINSADHQAYERMAAAIAEREVDQAIAFEGDLPSDNIAQVSTVDVVAQESFRPEPPKRQQSSIPTYHPSGFDELPARKLPAFNRANPLPASQVSVLRRSSPQTDDSNEDELDNLENELRSQRNSQQQPPQGSGSRSNSLPKPEPDKIDEEKKALEQRLMELEKETEKRETKRRQRELELEEKKSRAPRSRRNDLRGEFEDDSDEPDRDNRPVRLSCNEFRSKLLNQSIRDISLDISPRASRTRDQYIAISRSWTDRLGNVIASGAMVDLRRGYVIIDGVNGRQKVPFSKLSDADSSAVAEYWQVPELCSVGDSQLPQRHWVPQSFTWTASSLCHKPLYFENQQLERYGHTHGPILQPIHSTAHFFVSLATLPYATAIHPPTECRYALGYYRPGNCAPWLKDPIPVSLDGIRRQALVTTGLAFIP